MKKSKITILTKYILDFMFYAGILAAVALPFILKWWGNYNNDYAKNYYTLCIVFFISGVFAILIIKELRKIFQSVLADDCFIVENVKSLKKMAKYSFVISALTVIRVILFFTPGAYAIIIVFLIAGLFSEVLSQVFDKAITYKLENDLTI